MFRLAPETPFEDLRFLELPPVRWQLFALGEAPSDLTATPLLLVTFATRLLAKPLIFGYLSTRGSPTPETMEILEGVKAIEIQVEEGPAASA